MKYKVGDIVRYKDLYGTFKIIKCDEELGQYVAVEVKEVGSRIFNEWEEKNMVLEVSVNSSVKKYKLIDILNKIANGELKEGTKVKLTKFDIVYEYKNCNLWSNVCATESKVAINIKNLNEEVELIEPDHFADAGEMAEPTDNTKIEELIDWYQLIDGTTDEEKIHIVWNKLNDVIRRLNKGE